MSFFRSEPNSAVLQHIFAAEDVALAPYAVRSDSSRGRRFIELAHKYRTDYQRDRDRIIHSAAFRRLMHKTQVFVGHPNDHQRTRLTHTLEVAQIARTVARALRLNEDLTEAIALAHDLGHPPFGHAGERALAGVMNDHGGFEHNRQGLRLLEWIEQRYPMFVGLNLSYELLEAIAYRCKQPSAPEIVEFKLTPQMSAESQVVDLCDSIAYDTHDIDDAVRAGLITFDDLRTTELWRESEKRARQTYGANLDGKQLTRAVIRSTIDNYVGGLIETSTKRLAQYHSPAEVQQSSEPVVALPPELAEPKAQLEKLLFKQVYRHEKVTKTTTIAERMVRQLFEEIVRSPDLLPDKFRTRLDVDSLERLVCDHVAGMTDRFAQKLHRRLFEPG